MRIEETNQIVKESKINSRAVGNNRRSLFDRMRPFMRKAIANRNVQATLAGAVVATAAGAGALFVTNKRRKSWWQL